MKWKHEVHDCEAHLALISQVYSTVCFELYGSRTGLKTPKHQKSPCENENRQPKIGAMNVEEIITGKVANAVVAYERRITRSRSKSQEDKFVVAEEVVAVDSRAEVAVDSRGPCTRSRSRSKYLEIVLVDSSSENQKKNEDSSQRRKRKRRRESKKPAVKWTEKEESTILDLLFKYKKEHQNSTPLGVIPTAIYKDMQALEKGTTNCT